MGDAGAWGAGGRPDGWSHADDARGFDAAAARPGGRARRGPDAWLG